MFSGNKILDGLQAQHIEPTSNEAAMLIKNLGVEVAEKIIATHEALNAQQEVRITLRDGVMKDTEIIISKDGRALNVSFITGSDDSASILNLRSGDLRTQLMEKLNDVTRVDVEVEQREASDNQNSDGRSQNRFGNQREGEEEEEKKRREDEE
jgi:type III secretion system needle length determinant